MATGKPVRTCARKIDHVFLELVPPLLLPLFFAPFLLFLYLTRFVSHFSHPAHHCVCMCVCRRYSRTRNLLAGVVNRNDIKKKGRGEGREKREKLMSFYWELDHSSPCIVLWMQIGCNFIKGTLLRITYDRASIGP